MATLDPHYNSVSLLLPMEGVNNQTAFLDYSPSPKVITVAGNAKISNAQSKWGYNCGYFDGSGDYLACSGTEFTLVTNDFTIEFWFYGAARANRVLGNRPATGGWMLAITPGTATYFNFWTGGDAFNQVIGPAPTANAWNHVAACRAGNTYRVYTSGIGGTPLVTANRPGTSAEQLNIGRDISVPSTDNTLGYIQDLRITSYGVARYTANFTPPGRLVAPSFLDYPPLKTISGNCIVSGNGGAEMVVIRDWDSRELIATATPNATTGAWTADVPPGDYDISYFAPNCQPVCHGPYTVTA